MTTTNPEAALRTLPDLLFNSASLHSDVRALFDPHSKPIVELTYGQLAEEVKAFGAGLISKGLKPGDHVALFSDNQPRWLICDMAITGMGAVDVPRGSDTATGEFEFILEHSGSVAAVLENKKLYDRLTETAAFQGLRFAVLLDDADFSQKDSGPQVFKFSDVVEAGRGQEQSYMSAVGAVQPDTLATIVYTSGTTGSPKGVMLSHGNLMTQPLNVDIAIKPRPGEILLSVLPSWHAYERAVEYFGMRYGTTLTYSDKKYIREDLLKLCPHLFPCVPRIWEMVYKGIFTKVKSAPEKKQKLFQFFTETGYRYVRARRTALGFTVDKKPVSTARRAAAYAEMLALLPAYKLGDKLVYSKLRNVTGGRLRAAISGGGNLAPYLDDFFELAGIPILNGYGLTETSPVLTVRTLNRNVRGTVGQPITKTEISIRSESGHEVAPGETGEIWARGPQVMRGYYNNPEATAKVLVQDGWFITGDLGYFTPAGDLVITGRAKDTIVLSSGENVEPEPIEDACRKSPLVQQILLVGQDQKSLGALVVPDYPVLAEQLNLTAESEPKDLSEREDAARLVRHSLNQIMKADGRFKESESIARVYLLPEPFSDKNGMMTSTMKIKRNVVNERYKAQIEQLFR